MTTVATAPNIPIILPKIVPTLLGDRCVTEVLVPVGRANVIVDVGARTDIADGLEFDVPARVLYEGRYTI